MERPSFWRNSSSSPVNFNFDGNKNLVKYGKHNMGTTKVKNNNMRSEAIIQTFFID